MEAAHLAANPAILAGHKVASQALARLEVT